MKDPNSAAELPNGVEYVLARWAELVGEDCPWFALSPGVGLRLQLEELESVARAQNEGVLDARALKVLSRQANEQMFRRGGLLKRRYESLAEQLSQAISDEGGLIPGGRAFGLVQTAGRLLSEPAYRHAIFQELEHQAGATTRWEALRELDALTELLDAELLYLGHSAEWRARALARVRSELNTGKTLAESLELALAHVEDTHDMSVVLGIESLRSPPTPVVAIKRLGEDEVQDLIDGWRVDVADEDRELPNGAIVYDVKDAADPHAAMVRALEWFAVQRSLWRLQDGEVVLRAKVLVYQGPPAQVHVLERPAPMDLMPSGISAFQERLTNDQLRGSEEPSVLADAFVQLVQARASIPGAAIADLWSVAEAVFSGVAAESGAGAGEVMAGLSQYLYVQQLLTWLGSRYRRHHALGEPRPGQSDGDWALDLIATRTPDVVAAIEGDADPLAFLRTHHVLFWDRDRGLRDDLAAVDARSKAIGARAYLIRNLVVHRGQPQRARALAATLTPFAQLLRACLDHMATVVNDENAVPVTEAQMATARVRLLADDYAGNNRRGRGPDRLRAAVMLN